MWEGWPWFWWPRDGTVMKDLRSWGTPAPWAVGRDAGVVGALKGDFHTATSRDCVQRVTCKIPSVAQFAWGGQVT